MVDIDVGVNVLRERLAPLAAVDVRPLAGGASSLSYRATVTWGGDDRAVVVKVAPAGLEPTRNRDVLRQARVLRLLRGASLMLEARLSGPRLSVRDFLDLEEGHLLAFDFPLEQPIDLTVNGIEKFRAQVVSKGRRRACVIEEIRVPADQGKIKEEPASSLPALSSAG